MAQPIPKKIKENNPQIGVKTFNTLLVDGSNILELSSLADTTMSSSGKQIGGIFQFLLQLRILMQKGNFRYVYVFWDSEGDGGILRYRLYPEYKANRDKQFVDDENLSDYGKAVEKQIVEMQKYFFKKQDSKKLAEKKKQKDLFYWQREIVMQCLEELFIRQCLCEKTEADDFIGWYVVNKKPNERIVILSNDADIQQLIAEDVIVYQQRTKKFITTKNFKEEMGYDYHNVVLKKILCGDTSDNIKGIKGLGEKTLLTNFPQLKEKAVTLNEIIEGARQINEDRAKEKKKPLKWAENIVNRVTDGCQKEQIYNINEAIINLKKPLMTEDAKSTLSDMMYQPMDPEGRSLDNLYKIVLENDIDSLKDHNKFASFFTEFQYLIDKELKNTER